MAVLDSKTKAGDHGKLQSPQRGCEITRARSGVEYGSTNSLVKRNRRHGFRPAVTDQYRGVITNQGSHA